MTAEEIRSRYLSEFRGLWRTVRRLERIYPEFPDAPADRWRVAIHSLAGRLKTMPDDTLVQLGGSHTALRNLVADEMGLRQYDGQGATYGHRVLDINWE